MSQFRDAYDEFRRAGFEVAAISVDSPYSHRAWAKELGLEYPLISDFTGTFAADYHVPLSTGGPLPGTTSRSAFVSQAWELIFRNGVVNHALKELCRVYVSQSIECEY